MKLPRGSYKYCFEAENNSGTTAIGAATQPVQGPSITTGDAIPVLGYVLQGNGEVNVYYNETLGSIVYETVYCDADDDPPDASLPTRGFQTRRQGRICVSALPPQRQDLE